MQDKLAPDQEDHAFRAVLYPYRSLPPQGFLILMVAIGSMSFVTGLVFLSMGAWPVFGFFGLDVLLVYLAFCLNYRAGRAYELVELDRHLLTVTRVSPRGEKVTFDFNPYWVRVRLAERPDARTKLKISSHGRELELGLCLNDQERREFARVLDGALASARAP